MKGITVFGMIVGGVFILASFFVSVPDREISNPKKYIGGDAYNYQIEASIRGGEIAGAKITKALYLTGGLIVFFGSLIAFGFSNARYTPSYQRNISGSTVGNKLQKKCKRCHKEVDGDYTGCPHCGNNTFE
jgi:hypothetical protein